MDRVTEKDAMTRTWWSRTSRRLPHCVGCFSAREEVTGAVQLWRSVGSLAQFFKSCSQRRTRWSKLRDNPTLPRTEQVARKHSCASQAQEKCTKPRSSLNKNRTQLRKWKEDVLEVELPVEEDELVDDTAQGDREVRSAAEAAFFAWLACQAQTGGYQDGKGLTENLVESEYQFWSQGSRCCPTPVSAILTLSRRRATITENPTVLVKPAIQGRKGGTMDLVWT